MSVWKWTLRKIGFGRPELHKGLLEEKYFEPKRAFHHGVQNGASCIAYDPIQQILAIGAKDGTIKILGKPGIEVLLESQYRCPIRELAFIPGKGRLFCFFDYTVEEWDLESYTAVASRVFKSRITAHHMVMNCPYIFLGTEEGDVLVVNVAELVLSAYEVPYTATRGDHQTRGLGLEVVALETCPCAENQLLICFSDALVVLWNLKARKVTRKYFLPTAQLRAACWHADGKQFVTAHKDGEMCFWKAKDSKKPFQQMFSIQASAKDVFRPINKILWTQVKGEDMLLLQGGALQSEDDGLVILQGPTFQRTVISQSGALLDFVACHPSPWPGDSDPAMLILLNDSSQLTSYGVSRSLGFPKYPPPPSLIFQDSQIVSLGFYTGCDKALFSDLFAAGTVRFDPAYWLKGGQFSKQLVMGEDLLITCHDTGKMRFWDASSIALRLLLTLQVGAPSTGITAEEKKKQASSGDAKLYCQQYVTTFLFLPESRLLAIGCASGSVFLYSFSNSETFVEKKVYKHYKKDKGGRRKKKVPSTKRAVSPREREPEPSEDAPRLAASAREVSPQLRKSPSRVGAAPSGPPPSTAPPAKPAEPAAPTKPKDTASSPTQPSNPTATPSAAPSDAAGGQPGAPPGVPAEMPWLASDRPPKKVRVKRKPPSQPLPNLPADGARSPSPPPNHESKVVMSKSVGALPSTVSKASSTSPTADTQSKSPQAGQVKKSESPQTTQVKKPDSPQPQQQKLEASQIRVKVEPPRSPPAKAETNEQPAPAGGEQTQKPSKGSNIPAGLRLSLECTLGSVVKVIALAPSLNLIAIGDQQGTVTVVDTLTGECLFEENVNGTTNAIRCLTFSEAIMDEGDYEIWQQQHYGQPETNKEVFPEPLLLIGSDSGYVSVLYLDDMELDAHPYERKLPVPVILVEMVTVKGVPITLPTVEWEGEPAAAAADGEKEAEEDSVDKEVEDFVDVGAEDKGKAKEEAKPSTEKRKKKHKKKPRYDGERFVLVVMEDHLAVYYLPYFEQLARAEAPNPIVAAHLLCYKGEWCVVTFDNEIGVNVYTLTDLRLIMETDWNCFGPEMTPSAITQAAVSRDGRLVTSSPRAELHRLSFFLHENMLNLPGSLPTCHIRGLKIPDKPKALTKSIFSDSNLESVDLFSTPAPMTTSKAKRRTVLDEYEDDDDALIPKSKSRTGNTRREPRTATGGKIKEERNQVGEVKNIMAENINKVNERGEKLSELAQKTGELEAASEEYLRNIKEYTRKQRNKRWYQL